MSLVLNEDQQILKDTAKNFCQQDATISVLRKLRDEKDQQGYSREVWQKMAELGWTGMAIPEAHGGFDFGYGGLGVVLEETGHTLISSPLISTVLLSATAINLAGSDEQKAATLPAIVKGELIVCLAVDEKPVHCPTFISTRAQKSANGFTLNGRKVFVLDGHVADKIIVVARTSGEDDSVNGISLFLVDSGTSGIDIQRTHMVDNRNAATITFTDVEVAQSALLGELDLGYKTLQRTLDIGCIGLAAEMLGSVIEVFERIVDYLKTRKQFGVVIGSFQGLQHRAANMYSEIELCKSVVREAFSALDSTSEGQDENIAKLASLAKAKLSEVYFTVSNEGVQMHGGMGMTDEFDIGFFLKRARVAQQFLGDARFHRDRYATLHGF